MQQQIFDLIVEKDDVTWKTILYDLVKTEQMNPWDVDLRILTKKYVTTIKQMKETDLKISGKVLLAAAIMLKMKSHKLLHEDIEELDRLIASTEENEEDEFFSEFTEDLFDKNQRELEQKYQLLPRQPQPRSRKVSIYDLVDALQKAMETKKRKLAKIKPQKFVIPKKTFDIVETIRDVYARIRHGFQSDKSKKMTFEQLLPTDAQKRDKVHTFIPLLHLENQRRIETKQPKHFGDIFIKLNKKKNGQVR